jgi:hypothetical protein
MIERGSDTEKEETMNKLKKDRKKQKPQKEYQL